MGQRSLRPGPHTVSSPLADGIHTEAGETVCLEHSSGILEAIRSLPSFYFVGLQSCAIGTHDLGLVHLRIPTSYLGVSSLVY